MTQEEKQLLLADLSARLPYGVKVQGNFRYGSGEDIVDDIRVKTFENNDIDWLIHGIEIKPYLHPMSSMTEEERKEQYRFSAFNNIEYYDWLNAHHFDYRGLIEKGLALEAPRGMYKNLNNKGE